MVPSSLDLSEDFLESYTHVLAVLKISGLLKHVPAREMFLRGSVGVSGALDMGSRV